MQVRCTQTIRSSVYTLSHKGNCRLMTITCQLNFNIHTTSHIINIYFMRIIIKFSGFALCLENGAEAINWNKKNIISLNLSYSSLLPLLSWSDINSISGTWVSEGIARKTTCGFSPSAPVRLFRYQVFLKCGFVSFGGRLHCKPYQTVLRISRYPSRKRSFLITKIIGFIDELKNPHQ